jgi:hypothetical protein
MSGRTNKFLPIPIDLKVGYVKTITLRRPDQVDVILTAALMGSWKSIGNSEFFQDLWARVAMPMGAGLGEHRLLREIPGTSQESPRPEWLVE